MQTLLRIVQTRKAMYADQDNTDKYLFNYLVESWFIIVNFALQI